MRERRRLDEAIGAVKAIETELGDTVELIELGEAEGDQALADDGVAALAALADRADKDKVSALLAGEADANDTYIEINAGAGGTASQDWAEMLQRMYRSVESLVGKECVSTARSQATPFPSKKKNLHTADYIPLFTPSHY